MKTQLPTAGYLALLAIFFLAVSTLPLSAQETEKDSLYTQLNTYQSQDSFLLYFETLANLASYYKKTHRKDPKTRYKNTRALYEKHNIYREPLGPVENLSVRKFYASYLNSIIKTEGFSNHWLVMARKAHSMVLDNKLLDKYTVYIEMQLGHHFAMKNDYDQAIHYYLMCIPNLKNDPKKSRLAILYTGLGNGYKWQDNFDQARHYYTKGLELAYVLNDPKAIAANLSNLSSFYLDNNNYSAFLKHHKELGPLLKKLHDPHLNEERLARHDSEYARYLKKQKKYDLAREYVKHAHEHLFKQHQNKTHRSHAKLDLFVAQMYLEEDNIEQSKALIQQGLARLIPSYNISTQEVPTTLQIYDENTIIDLISTLTQVYQKEYQETKDPLILEKISKACKVAIQSNELLRESMVLTSSKVQSTEDTRAFINYQIDNFYFKNSKPNLSKTRLDEITEILAKSKNLLVQESVSINQQIAASNQETQDSIQGLQKSIISAIALKKEPNHNLEEIELSIQQNKNSIKELLSNNKQDLNQDQGLHKNYLEYILTDSSAFLLVNLNEQKQFYQLCKTSKLVAMITELHATLPEMDKLESLNQQLDLLSKVLLPPSIKLPKSFNVILEGPLATIPFDILRIDEAYLIQNHEFNLLQDTKIKEDKEGLNLNATLLNPEYKKSNKQNLVPLLYSETETQKVANALDDYKLVSSSNIFDLKEDLKGTNLFHFAGHAIIDYPEAYLALKNDLRWHEEQIRNASLELSLVTLSACESGLGPWQKGDGLQSLGRSFLASGTDAVVYTLWNINDQSSVTLMGDFYKNLSAGLNVNQSLIESKRNYLASNPKELCHPYYWAAYVATGNTSISTVGHKNKILWGIFLSALLFLFIFRFIKTSSS